MSRSALAAVSPSAGFAADPRFGGMLAPHGHHEDPIARARAEGFAAGRAQAEADARDRAEAETAVGAKLELACARLDAAQHEALRQRLVETVTALCEASLAPLALDPELLTRRAERAAAMLARADDTKVLRLHPADIALLAGRLPENWEVQPDSALERGALRIESADGGVEDGPGLWRRTIIEALGGC